MSVDQLAVSKVAPELNSSRKVRVYCDASCPAGEGGDDKLAAAIVTSVSVAEATMMSIVFAPDVLVSLVAVDDGDMSVLATGVVAGVMTDISAVAAGGIAMAGATVVSVAAGGAATEEAVDVSRMFEATGEMVLMLSVDDCAPGLEPPPPQAARVRQKSRGDMLVVRVLMMDFRSRGWVS